MPSRRLPDDEPSRVCDTINMALARSLTLFDHKEFFINDYQNESRQSARPLRMLALGRAQRGEREE